ncbi:cobyric acid synthase [Nocardia otitidiscaviarum]|uniref:Lipid II isoglutaminyl synthase (glutamine-hydrolyzing) subunit GatD n=1 Tax=Nocardia otitidiscaviarum TaxID=1823 RepID=A0A378YFG5_9NOCA|nr:cobyric acid synthase [Nocardia otitidiscaviarum]
MSERSDRPEDTTERPRDTADHAGPADTAGSSAAVAPSAGTGEFAAADGAEVASSSGVGEHVVAAASSQAADITAERIAAAARVEQAAAQGQRSSESTVRIGLVLPDVMGTYGDGGNAVVLRQRLRMRGYDAEIVEISLSEPVPDSLDIYTLGGAEDSAQRLATRHLQRYPGLQTAAGRGVPVLAICAAIQVLGHWYETSSGERVDGVGLIDVTTSPQAERAIGEVVTNPILAGLSQPLTGFENHRGGTKLGGAATGLARVTRGVGNGVGDGLEGVVQGSVIGTYMHGPALARNPELADYLLAKALGVDSLPPLDLPEVEQLRRERLRA